MTSSSPVTRHIPASRHPSRYEEDPDTKPKAPVDPRRNQVLGAARRNRQHRQRASRAHASRQRDQMAGRAGPRAARRRQELEDPRPRCLRRASHPQGHARHRIPRRADFARRSQTRATTRRPRRRAHVPVRRRRRHLHRCGRRRQSRRASSTTSAMRTARPSSTTGASSSRRLRTIEPGEELGYDYQLTWESTDDPEELKLYACRCGAAELPRHDARRRAARREAQGSERRRSRHARKAAPEARPRPCRAQTKQAARAAHVAPPER